MKGREGEIRKEERGTEGEGMNEMDGWDKWTEGMKEGRMGRDRTVDA